MGDVAIFEMYLHCCLIILWIRLQVFIKHEIISANTDKVVMIAKLDIQELLGNIHLIYFEP